MADSSAHSHNPGYGPPPKGNEEWDAWYAARDQVWSGNPNGALVAEVATEPPGRALDVGCGEGADAIWLTQQGWQVTGLDVSEVALERGRAAADAAGVQVDWVLGTLSANQLAGATFDLVTTHYPAILRAEGPVAIDRMLASVAPDGVLLAVFHADIDTEEAKAHGFDPADYLDVDDIRAGLDAGWSVDVDERRARQVAPESAGAHHTHDLILRARRRAPA